VNSLTGVGRSPHRQTDGALTPDGLAGRMIFDQQGCFACHAGTTFSDSARGALHRVGTQKVSSGSRLGAAIPGFDTPSLKGLWRSAPYLHDGSAATLDDVLMSANAYDFHAPVSALTASRRAQLTAYLLQIDDLEPAANQTAVPVFSINLAVPADQVRGKFVLTLTFSEPVTGLKPGDLQVINATLGNLKGSGSVYTVQVTPWSRGPLTVTLAANSIKSGGLPNSAPMNFHVLAHRHIGYRYAKLVAESGTGPWASMAEFYLRSGGSQLARTGWSIHSVSSEQTSPDNKASRALDGLANTYWHTRYNDTNPPTHPHEIVFDLGGLRVFDTFEYLPRQDGNLNGTIGAFRLLGSGDALNWEQIDQGAFALNNSAKIEPLQILPASALDRWIESQLSPSGPQPLLYWSADGDGDSRPNWLEWVALSSLNQHDVGPAFTLKPEILTDSIDNREYLGVSTPINPEAADQLFWIDSSTGLSVWKAESINGTRIDLPTDPLNPDGTRMIRFIDSVAVKDAPKRFLRLQLRMKAPAP